jgi:pimeloyl-ACP methyl ester carboxylesterase
VEPAPFEVRRDSLTLRGEQAGDGPPIVLLHGLSATRRNVVQGSRHLIKRGYRLISYDARGHGASSPAERYEYADLVEDLEAVLARLGLERAALAGSSMGAATAMAFALEHPERVPALVQITPAYTGYARTGDVDVETWERLASALEEGGVEGFVQVAQPDGIPERWREIAREATRQRMGRHEHPEAVAQALRQVPRSIAWKGLGALEELAVPVLLVGSRDEADAMHPLAVAVEYERRLPRAELVVEDEGKSPLAWQGARLSGAIGDFLERAGYPPS